MSCRARHLRGWDESARVTAGSSRWPIRRIGRSWTRGSCVACGGRGVNPESVRSSTASKDLKPSAFSSQLSGQGSPPSVFC
jgi:hypothetical protein